MCRAGICAIVCLSCIFTSSSYAAVRYVDHTASGLGDGSSWANAFLTLQDALGVVQAGDEIWLAKGTYTPSASLDQTVSFNLVEGVALYGGFTGSETMRSARDPQTHICVLSGDLSGNDTTDPLTRSENSHLVLFAQNLTNATVLDGITVSGGIGLGPPNWWDLSASMYCEGSDLIINDVIFEGFTGIGSSNNIRIVGGSSPSFTDCHFKNNGINDGSGVVLFIESTPSFYNCLFENNRARNSPISSNDSSPLFSNCTFLKNYSGGDGGAVSLSGPDSTPTLIDCLFEGNEALDDGGALRVGAAATIDRCKFYANHASDDGGALFAAGDPFTITNSIMVGNTCLGAGGAISGGFATGVYPTVTNCTLTQNHGRFSGGISGYVRAVNSIIWGNSSNSVDAPDFSPLPETNSSNNIIFNPQLLGPSPYGNDPLLVRSPHSGDGDWSTLADNDYGDLHVQSGSVAIDAGSLTELPAGITVDFGGDPRVVALSVDIGAQESDFLGVGLQETAAEVPGNGLPVVLADWCSPPSGFQFHFSTISTAGTIAYDSPPIVGVDGSLQFTLEEGSSGVIVFTVYTSDPSGVFADSSPMRFLIRTEETSIIWLVDQAAPPDGTGITWASAFRSPQDALGQALEGDEIWIAEGSYTPTSGTSRTITFNLLNNVSLYGGFPQGGGDGTFSARQPASYLSTLSGDLLGNDDLDPSSTAENSLRVVTASNLTDETKLNGFHVVGGGGLLVENSTLSVEDVHFSKNTYLATVVSSLSNLKMISCSLTGNSNSPALAAGGGNVEIDDCSFTDNFGGYSHGSGETTIIRIRNSTFQNNGDASSSHFGALDFSSISSATVESCTFIGNTAFLAAGAIDALNTDLVVTDSHFLENSSSDYGGAIKHQGDELTLNRCRFEGNSSEKAGGAIYTPDAAAFIMNCLFVGNRTAWNGGAIYCGRPTEIYQSTFVGNQSDGFGGAIWTHSFDTVPQLVLSNSIFWDNQSLLDISTSHIEGLLDESSRNNLIPDGSVEDLNTYTFSPSFIRFPDPGDGDWSTPDDNDYGDLHLSLDSEAIGAGSNDGVPDNLTTDIDGNPRIQGISVDLGAYETNKLGMPVSDVILTTVPDGTPFVFENWAPSTSPFLVTVTTLGIYGDIEFTGLPSISSEGTMEFTLQNETSGAALFRIEITDPGGNFLPSAPLDFVVRTAGVVWKVGLTGQQTNHGLDWNSPLPAIQDALERALPNDQIWVAAGTYKPVGQNQPINLVEGVKVYGGFRPDLGMIDLETRDKDPLTNGTVLSGDLQGDDTPGFLNRSDNSFSVVLANRLSTATLDGFTIKSGYAVNGRDEDGAGLGVFSSTISLSNLYIFDNWADGLGAGIYITGGRRSSPALVNMTECIIEGNHSNQNGGGVYSSFTSELSVSNSIFRHNTTDGSGGGICGTGDSIMLTQSRFGGNIATNSGGALSNQRGSLTTSSCLFVGNHAEERGGAISNESSSILVSRNCTIAGNRATLSGGGISGQDITLYNSIIWGNSAGDPTSDQIEPHSSVNGGSHNTIEGWTSSTDFLRTDDPLFVRPPDPGDGSWTTINDNDYGDLRLLPASRSINTGLNSEVLGEEDVCGETRIRNTIVDRGAYENAQTAITFPMLFPDLSFDGDANSNGHSNYFDYATGLNPTSQESSSASLTLMGDLLIISRRTDSIDTPVTYLHSTNLRHWSPLIEDVHYTVESRDTSEADREIVTLRLLLNDSKHFFVQQFTPPPKSFSYRFPYLDPEADANGNGLTNFTEHYFGINPTAANFAGAVEVDGAVLVHPGVPTCIFHADQNFGGTAKIRYSRRKDYNAGGVEFVEQFSSDLVNWFTSTETPVVIANDGELEAVDVKFPEVAPVGMPLARFARVLLVPVP